MEKNKNYFIFWLGESISQLGSAMTTFALTIWAFEKTQSAMAVSFMTFCTYAPYILVSVFAGGFIDRNSKKAILIVSDVVAAVCSVFVLIFAMNHQLKVEHIYLVNLVVGFMNAFQAPASSVVTGLLAPDGEYERVSGLQSFSGNLIMVGAPVLSGMLTGFGNLSLVLVVDLTSFLLCMASLLIVRINEPAQKIVKKGQAGKMAKPGIGGEGLAFLKKEKGILCLMGSMALINFFSRLTYENILSPMILSRSGGNTVVFGIVSGSLGIGGILGGIMVAAGKKIENPGRMIYVFAGISFLFGDLLMGAGRNVWMWLAAGLAASIPIPFVMAGQTTILYRTVPREIQGRIFALRNGIQYSTIPAGILLGGALADYVFEPYMASARPEVLLMQKIVGSGSGSGMAVMFLCTGILGALSSFLGYKNKHIRELSDRIVLENNMS